MSVPPGYWVHTHTGGDRMTESDKTQAQRWMDLLGEDGFRPRLEVNDEHPEQLCIYFKSEGTKYLLFLDDRDATFFNLSLCYNLGEVAGAGDFALLNAANEENRHAKGTKVTVDLEDRVAYFNIEGFGEAPPSPEMFERMVGQCSYSADCFFSTLRKSTKPVPLAS